MGARYLINTPREKMDSLKRQADCASTSLRPHTASCPGVQPREGRIKKSKAHVLTVRQTESMCANLEMERRPSDVLVTCFWAAV